MTTDTSGTAADQAAVVQAPMRIIAAWEANDATAFGAACTEDATMILPGDVCLRGRDEIREYMAGEYAGKLKGTRVTGTPLSLRFPVPGTAIMVTEGGVLLPGETEVSAPQAIRATWVLAKDGDDWLITAYHNSPLHVG
ncbi:SgcJ/EcaC family oxidoreductase [Actinomadura flavalba]|uniref:SgcJ/EcaC family oxidoreductase n=1 Tax=Actinomadura flavalba TaxID=1120938 RepID=UPI000360A2D3|nr:SgcJ/EcaC family oxidoreductase [Actinomadura flavalba]